MKKLSRNAIIGYPAGIISGIAYGLNPLFAKPLMSNGASVESILFFRYLFAVAMLGAFLWMCGRSFRVTAKQAVVLVVLGLLYAASSLCLFGAYNYIASGLATTLVFLSPVLVAVIMACLGVVPSWPVWLAIVATFGGMFIMAHGSEGEVIDPWGVVLSLGSALAYALFVVVINRSKVIEGISHTLLTFYALAVGVVVFLGKMLVSDAPATEGLDGGFAWLCIVGHALLPTIVSIATLAVSARNIGATKATVLGVFEPIAAILVGTIVFDEPLTLSIVAGICISIVAVTVMIVLTKR